jgi:outer membrane protein assembly factor BamB
VIYPWSQRGRGPLGNSYTPYTAPSDFSAGPSWKWNNEEDEQVRHSPLIDNEMNVYVATANRIRKFSKDGMLLWTWQNKPEEGKMVASPALYEGAVYLITRTGPESGPPPVLPKLEDADTSEEENEDEEEEPHEDEKESEEDGEEGEEEEEETDKDADTSEMSLLQTKSKSNLEKPWWEAAAEKEEAADAVKQEAIQKEQDARDAIQREKEEKEATKKKEVESIPLPPVRSSGITMVSLNMTTGNLIWNRSEPLQQNSDPGSVFVHNGTMVFALGNDDLHVQQPNTKGNNIVYAVKASDGSYLWEVVADDVFYNFAAATPGDGTFLFSSSCGSVFRVSFDGQLVWRKGDPEMNLGYHCSSGGGALGSNGVYYVEYDDMKDNTKGARLAAYQVSDGALLWKKVFNSTDRGLQHPAVGRLGSDGPLAVLVAVGQGFSETSDSTAQPSKVDAPVAAPVALEAQADTQEKQEATSEEEDVDDSATEESKTEPASQEQGEAGADLLSEGSVAESKVVSSVASSKEEIANLAASIEAKGPQGVQPNGDIHYDQFPIQEKKPDAGPSGSTELAEEFPGLPKGLNLDSDDMAKEWKEKNGFGKRKKGKKGKVDYAHMYFGKTMADAYKAEKANETKMHPNKTHSKEEDDPFWAGGDKMPTWMKWLPANAFDDTVLLQTGSQTQQLPVDLSSEGSEVIKATGKGEKKSKKSKKRGHSKRSKNEKELGDLEKPQPRQPARQLANAVVALDAESGEVLWRFNEDPWEKMAGAGESERALERVSRAMKDDQTDVLCTAETQGTPLIGGDGTVYMSSGHSGDLRAIRDVNRDGVIDTEREVSLFKTDNCFLNSPSLAPGMLVAAPCWGPMYVFKL